MKRVRVVLGGVGTVPWRAQEIAHALRGQSGGTESFRKAAEAALKDERTSSENGFRVGLAQAALCVPRQCLSSLPNRVRGESNHGL